jgi:hypothetical protein
VRAESSTRYAAGLWVLLALFAFRVVAQPLSLVIRSGMLPQFESWHSGALPYSLLVASQLVILAALVWTAWRFTIGAVTPRHSVGVVALAFGGLYFVGMLARLALGLTVLSRQRWFASPLPTVFHLVLAAFVLLFGHFHYVHGGAAASNR